MTDADTTVESLAQRLAAEGRDALVERLRGAYADAAAAHSDIVRLDDARIEQMVQDAADRADGLQWRRALATVASQELGIELSTALSHPAVARAQKLVGAPTYEDSLAELVGDKYAGPTVGPHAGEPASSTPTDPEPDSEPDAPEASQEPAAAPATAEQPSHAGEAVIEEPEPLDADASEDEFLPPPTPLRPVAPPPPAPPIAALPVPELPAASDSDRPAADLAGGAHRSTPTPARRPSTDRADTDEAKTAVHQLPPPNSLPATGEHEPPRPTHSIGGDTPKRPSYGPAADLQSSNVTPLHGAPADAEEQGLDGVEHDLDTDLGYPTAAWDAHTEGGWTEEDDHGLEHEHEDEDEDEDDVSHEGTAQSDLAHEGELRLSAFHLGGVANLPTGKEPIDVLLSANGLDILRPSGEIVGRLGWSEIETLDVPVPRGRRRRRANRDRAELVVRTRHGDASFEVPGFTPEELQETVDPAMARFNRLSRPSF